MSRRAVYDTMVFFQWAALAEDRQHSTVKAIYDGRIRLCMSQALLDEVRDVLNRQELREKVPSLRPERVKLVLGEILERAEWLADIPSAFTWKQHPDDDHVFNLAIAAKARYLVTWETRIRKLAAGKTDDARKLRTLAPQLEVISPKQLAQQLTKAEGL